MEYSLFSKEKVNRCKKKVIPWHVQKRYMESLSQLSLNQTIATAFYKKEINSLKRNNKHLALALQQSRYLATEKENLMLENGKILDIVNFSRLKLMDMATNMKQATVCLDETLLLLNSAIGDNLLKCSPNNRNYRNEFKSKLQDLNIEPIKEVMESASKNLDCLNKTTVSCIHKGKISRVDDCTFPPNKKCKLGKKAEKVKRNSKDVPQSAEKSVTALPNTTIKNTSGKNSKKCSSACGVKSQRKKSLPKSSNIESPSSSKLSSSNSSLQGKNKKKYQDKNCKAVKVVLTDIAEAFVNLQTNEPISAISSTNFKCFTQNSEEDNMLIKKYISSKINSKNSSGLISCSPPFASTINDAETPPFPPVLNDAEESPFASTINDAEVHPFASTINDAEIPPFPPVLHDAEEPPFASTINDEVHPFDFVNDAEAPISSQNTSNSSNFSLKNLSSAGDIPVIMEDLPALPSEENKDFMFDSTSTVEKMHLIKESENNTQPNNGRYVKNLVEKMQPIKESVNNTEQNNGRCIKNSDSEKDKRSYKSHNSKVSRRVQFYFDEDSIESADGETASSKNNRVRKGISKCKARKTVSNVKRNISSKGTALKPNCILPDNVSKLGKNSFLVTAEVHSPPNGVYYAQENRSKMCVTKKKEPRVVLTDIFKSNQGLLSEMVGNVSYGKGCLRKTDTSSAESPLATIPTIKLETVYMDCENNAENRCLLPVDRKIIEKRGNRRQGKVVSYKEPSLNVKMRRLM